MASPVGIVIAALVAVFVGFGLVYVMSVYNRLVRLSQQCEKARRNIDVLLRQRQSELAKLIDAVSEYISHERELLIELSRARELADKANTPTEEAEADRAVRQALASFRARSEAYPELKSSTNMQLFQERITDIENRIAARREFYNAAGTTYNTRIKQLPYALFATWMGFSKVDLFSPTDEETADIDVEMAFAG